MKLVCLCSMRLRGGDSIICCDWAKCSFLRYLRKVSLQVLNDDSFWSGDHVGSVDLTYPSVF